VHVLEPAEDHGSSCLLIPKKTAQINSSLIVAETASSADCIGLTFFIEHNAMEFQTPILSIEDIAALEEKYNQELLSGRGVDKQTKFNYAFALVQSEYRQDLQRGIALLEGIFPPHTIRLTWWSISQVSATHDYVLLTDLLKAEPGNRDYTYYHALGLYRSQQYADARVAIAALLRAEPGNRQALMLRDEIDAAVLRGVCVHEQRLLGCVAADIHRTACRRPGGRRDGGGGAWRRRDHPRRGGIDDALQAVGRQQGAWMRLLADGVHDNVGDHGVRLRRQVPLVPNELRAWPCTGKVSRLSPPPGWVVITPSAIPTVAALKGG
jgi:fission 1 protein